MDAKQFVVKMIPQYIECRGSHFEMGVIQGMECRKSIHQAFRLLQHSSTLRHVKPFFLTMKLFLKLMDIRCYFAINRMVKSLARMQWERMNGIAKGAEIDVKRLYGALFIELTQYLGPYRVESCTSIALEPAIAGETVICKNFDYPNDFGLPQIVRYNRPEKGFSTLDFTYPVLAGNHNGMNEFGLACLYTVVTPTHQTPGLPPTLLIQELLERCRNVDEAIKFLVTSKRGRGANYMLGDSDGKIAVVETTSRFFSVRRPKNGYIVSTNHFLTPKMITYDIPKNAIFTTRAFAPWRGKRVRESTEHRFRRATALVREFIASKKKLSYEDLFFILRDHDCGMGGETTVCNHGSIVSTLGSVVMLPKQRKIFVLNGKPCEERFAEFRIQ